jgi:hypothetical protein
MTIKEDHAADVQRAPRLLAAGGILAAIAAASCCVVPFALFLSIALCSPTVRCSSRSEGILFARNKFGEVIRDASGPL